MCMELGAQGRGASAGCAFCAARVARVCIAGGKSNEQTRVWQNFRGRAGSGAVLGWAGKVRDARCGAKGRKRARRAEAGQGFAMRRRIGELE
jgi:hypothetical protein